MRGARKQKYEYISVKVFALTWKLQVAQHGSRSSWQPLPTRVWISRNLFIPGACKIRAPWKRSRNNVIITLNLSQICLFNRGESKSLPEKKRGGRKKRGEIRSYISWKIVTCSLRVYFYIPSLIGLIRRNQRARCSSSFVGFDIYIPRRRVCRRRSFLRICTVGSW